MTRDIWAHLEPNFVCPICGTLKYFPGGMLKWRKTCSKACYQQWRVEEDRKLREVHNTSCEECGEVFPANATYKKRNARFCGRKCFADYRRRTGIMRGNGNHRYKGLDWARLARYIRDSAPYENWAKMVRERANGKCEKCDRDGEHSHHMFPISDIMDFLLDVEFGQYLCKECHNSSHPPGYTSKINSIKQVLRP